MQGLRGAALDNALADQTARHIRLASLVEQPPDPENRVTLGSARDVYGVPVPRLAYRLDDYTKAGFAASVEAHDAIFARARARPGCSISPVAQGAGHIIGTARMGDDAASARGRPRPAEPRPCEPLHPRLERLPDLGDRQSRR